MSHPPVAQMVNAAIAALKDRKGSSLASIKKYIAANYKCDVQKLAPFIRRYVRKAVSEGRLVQTKGTGASGSFRLGAAAKKAPKKKKAKKPKKPKKKKAKKAKKAKKPKKAKKAKKPKKAKKAKSAKAKKPKAKKSKAKKSAKKAKKSKKWIRPHFFAPRVLSALLRANHCSQENMISLSTWLSNMYVFTHLMISNDLAKTWINQFVFWLCIAFWF